MTPLDVNRTRTVILCDTTGRATGSAEIVAAHSGEGQLHLAFSVYVFNRERTALLIQQRSVGKPLWPLVWANTCCSHPRAGEKLVESGRRRLMEEMGIDCELAPGPEFVYRASDPQGRGVEHEYDIILTGTHSGDPMPNPDEVAAWRWANLDSLIVEMRERPEQFAPWFHTGLRLLQFPV